MPKRITFRDEAGNLVWFDPETATHCWVDLSPGDGFALVNLVRLPNGVWVKYPEPNPGEVLTDATVLTDEEALDWLLSRGNDPPSALNYLLKARNLASRALPQMPEKVRSHREIVHDKNDPNKWFALETSRAEEWKLEGYGVERRRLLGLLGRPETLSPN